MSTKIKEAVKEFCKNDYWKEYYEKAPSENCKKYIEYTFVQSLFGVDEDNSKNKKEVSNKLKYNDWKHLHKYAGNNPFKIFCEKKMKETK